jgi:signal transduction histidine kinase
MPQPGFVERRKDPDPFERRLAALTAIGGVDPSQDLAGFCADLTTRVAQLVKAQKVLFSVVEDGSMVAQPGTYGFGPEILALVVPCTPEGNGFADEIVYHGMVFRGAITDDPAFNPYRDALLAMQVSNAIAVGVKAGSEPVGLLAAFDSERPDGFTDEDIRLLRIAAAAAGLLWRQKQTSDQRARLHDEARALNEAMRSMVNAIVHELRAPLGVARGYLDMLKDESFGSLPGAMAKPLQTVSGKIGEATKLVDDLLLSARLESGSVESRPVQVDLGTIAASVAEREGPRAQLADGQVLTQEAVEPIIVLADPDHVTTIVANLVRNGIAYSRGAPDVRIQVRGNPQPTIMVIDQGKGIPPESQPHIFERFYRVQDRTSPPGTGLGLYISRQLAKQEGGELDLEWTEVGRGSAFALRFPKPR